MQDTFDRAHTRPSARATIGYRVYKILYMPIFGHTHKYDRFWSFFRIWPPIFFKGLPEIQFYVDFENFMKNIESLLSSIILNVINCLNIANGDMGDFGQF